MSRIRLGDIEKGDKIYVQDGELHTDAPPKKVELLIGEKMNEALTIMIMSGTFGWDTFVAALKEDNKHIDLTVTNTAHEHILRERHGEQ